MSKLGRTHTPDRMVDRNRDPAPAWQPPPLAAYEGDGVITPETLEAFARTYWEHLGNLAATCRATGVGWRQASALKRAEGPVRTRLLEVEAILAEEAHGEFVRRVYNPETRSPSWMLFYLKNRDPRYAEGLGPKGKVVPTVADEQFARHRFARQERALRVVPDAAADAAS